VLLVEEEVEVHGKKVNMLVVDLVVLGAD